MSKEQKEGETGLRVVLDTNVYISAFAFPTSRMFPIWLHAKEGSYKLVVSPYIVSELAETLRDRFSWNEARVQKQLRLLVQASDVVSPSWIPNAIDDDPDDDHILACALAGRAHVIVSGDRHLRKLKEYEGIGIIRPTDFLRMLPEPGLSMAS